MEEDSDDSDAIDGYDWERVREAVRRNFKPDLTRDGLFARVTHDLFGNAVGTEAIIRYFKVICTNPEYDWTNHNLAVQLELIARIGEEIERLQTGIAVWPCKENDSFRFLNERYALLLSYVDERRRLFLLDNYHGEKREFFTQNVPLNVENTRDYMLKMIDMEHVILLTNSTVHNQMNFHLLRLNFSTMQCSLLSSQQLNTPTATLIFDENCRRKFLIWTLSEEGNLFRFARVEEDSLIVDDRYIQFNHTIFYSRLEGNSLQAMTLNYNEAEMFTGDHVFGEFRLTPGVHNPVFKKLFLINYDHLKYYLNRPSSWQYTSPTSGYSYVKNICGFDALLFHSFDLIEQKKRLKKLCLYWKAGIRDMHLADGSEAATVCIHNKSTNEFIVHRFPMKQPDSLINLSFLAIRRQSIFQGSKLYRELVPRLPPNLQPFSICSTNSRIADNTAQSSDSPSKKKPRRTK